jgi:hypothetical protein
LAQYLENPDVTCPMNVSFHFSKERFDDMIVRTTFSKRATIMTTAAILKMTTFAVALMTRDILVVIVVAHSAQTELPVKMIESCRSGAPVVCPEPFQTEEEER